MAELSEEIKELVDVVVVLLVSDRYGFWFLDFGMDFVQFIMVFTWFLMV